MRYYGQYEPAPGTPVYQPTLTHYAIVVLVGAFLGAFFGRRAILPGAALYTLGFWIRGQARTPVVLTTAEGYIPPHLKRQLETWQSQFHPHIHVATPDDYQAAGIYQAAPPPDVIDASELG